ncbi:MAG: TonB-dependent receptor domain-containing protein [Raineya sp.]
MAILCVHTLQAQYLQGKLQDKKQEPVVGASVFWLGTATGTTSDINGNFTLPISQETNKLVVSAVGFINDTISVSNANFLAITLSEDTQSIETIEVRAASSFKDKESVQMSEFISRKELTKAACCNLSESFETNASIDVSYQDAVTGTKQIKMLGLDGTNTLITTENLPFLRGLASTYGLNFIPGTWINSIDVAKGAGSVVNGYESMAGQINVELLKPEMEEKILLNAYLNHFGRMEGNWASRHKINEKWSGNILAHASTLRNKVDRNQDNFLDLPLYTQYNAMLRLKRSSEKMMNQFGVKFLHDNREAGNLSFFENPNNLFAYGTATRANRGEFFSKNAILYPQKPYQGLGLATSAIWHEQIGFLGQNNYKGEQKTLYNNLIYQNIIGNTQNTYKIGISHTLDVYEEIFKDSTFSRRENILGVFSEYTYIGKKFNLVLGNRLDRHNLFGWIYTPRLHSKYNFNENTMLRFSVGRGFRVPNPIAENWGFLVNNRNIIVAQALKPEISWNYGLSLQKEFPFFSKKATLTADFFRTHFQNQLVVDMDRDATELHFNNLQGQSFANSFQTELTFNPFAGFDAKLAYKFYDVKTTLVGILQERPFVSRHRFFINASYETRRSGFQFDATLKWNGKQRLPVSHNPLEAQETLYSPAFATLNAQVSKKFSRKFEAYIGGENITNVRQLNPIIAADNPQSIHFDASMIWGPIVGVMVYSGVRVKL